MFTTYVNTKGKEIRAAFQTFDGISVFAWLVEHMAVRRSEEKEKLSKVVEKFYLKKKLLGEKKPNKTNI